MNRLVIILSSLVLTSCMGTRFLESGSSIIVKDPKILGLSKQMSKELENNIIQKPNKKLAGILPVTHLVYAYKIGEHLYDTAKYNGRITEITLKNDEKIKKAKRTGKKNRLSSRKAKKTDKLIQKIKEGNWLMRTGEQLSVFDSSLQNQTVIQFEQYLNTKGYFKSTAQHKTNTISSKKLSVEYIVNLTEPYYIDTITYKIQDKVLLSVLNNNSRENHLVSGKQYNQDDFNKERETINALLLNNGYYGFNRQFISFQVDTTSLGNKKAIVHINISSPDNREHKQYRLDSIIFNGQIRIDSGSVKISSYNNVTYRFGVDRYKRKVVDWRLFIREDSLYSRRNTIETQRQLTYVDAFKYVNINYDTTVSDGLIARIYTYPLSKYQTSYELGFLQEISQSVPGPFANFGLQKRNAFRGLETVKFNGALSILGISNVVGNENRYSLFEYGGGVDFTFPQFLFPTSSSFKRKIGPYNPKTIISSNYSFESRSGEYIRTRLNTSYAYQWRLKNEKQFTFAPINFSLTNPIKKWKSFETFLEEQESLGNGSIGAGFKKSINSSTSASVLLNNNSYGNPKKNSSMQQYFLETGGLLKSLFSQSKLLSDYTVFRWVKFNYDYRKLVVLRNSSLAFHINLGTAYTFKNDDETGLPYEKRFYSGGSNGIRSWKVRRLGPGAYGIIDQKSEDYKVAIINYQLEQGGDVIIEGTMEYRKNLIGFLDYALFMDFGNIWIWNSDVNLLDAEGDDGRFRMSSFYKEFAVGAGLGLRFDFSFLVFRIDGGFQVVDPAQPEGNRFIANKLNLLSFNATPEKKDIFRNKTNLNIGIGLPF